MEDGDGIAADSVSNGLVFETKDEKVTSRFWGCRSTALESGKSRCAWLFGYGSMFSKFFTAVDARGQIARA